MDFSDALLSIKAGRRVRRSGWNGKGMYIFLVDSIPYDKSRSTLPGLGASDTKLEYLPHINMKTADNKVVPWLASQTDILAIDYEVVI